MAKGHNANGPGFCVLRACSALCVRTIGGKKDDMLCTFTGLEILITSWYLSLFILVVYYQVVFIPRYRRVEVTTDFPQQGVSVLIAVKNGSNVMASNLPHIANQRYPLFEIIIVDDHSDESEQLKLQSLADQFSSVTYLASNAPQGKKHALSVGINHAQYPYILCTDADCKPLTSNWINAMMSASETNAVVLGYSPYEKRKGWLNRMIRFETIMTAMQYLSWTMLGRPYMAVGRNLLYPKNVFQQLNPFEKTLHIPYGDDDNLVQAASGKVMVVPCIEPESFVESQPQHNLRAWLRQKHRHLSAGFQYSRGTWWQPGLFAIVLIWHWLVAIILAMCCLSVMMIAALMIALILRWILYAGWAMRLRDRDTVMYYPLLEVLYAVYLAYTGVWTILSKRLTWN